MVKTLYLFQARQRQAEHMVQHLHAQGQERQEPRKPAPLLRNIISARMPESLIIKSLYRLKAEDLLLKRYNVLKDHRHPPRF